MFPLERSPSQTKLRLKTLLKHNQTNPQRPGRTDPSQNPIQRSKQFPRCPLHPLFFSCFCGIGTRYCGIGTCFCVEELRKGLGPRGPVVDLTEDDDTDDEGVEPKNEPNTAGVEEELAAPQTTTHSQEDGHHHLQQQEQQGGLQQAQQEVQQQDASFTETHEDSGAPAAKKLKVGESSAEVPPSTPTATETKQPASEAVVLPPPQESSFKDGEALEEDATPVCAPSTSTTSILRDFLGNFVGETAAAKAYDYFAVARRGIFAHGLNFPMEALGPKPERVSPKVLLAAILELQDKEEAAAAIKGHEEEDMDADDEAEEDEEEEEEEGETDKNESEDNEECLSPSRRKKKQGEKGGLGPLFKTPETGPSRMSF